jgi:hypothetical protein
VSAKGVRPLCCLETERRTPTRESRQSSRRANVVSEVAATLRAAKMRPSAGFASFRSEVICPLSPREQPAGSRWDACAAPVHPASSEAGVGLSAVPKAMLIQCDSRRSGSSTSAGFPIHDFVDVLEMLEGTDGTVFSQPGQPNSAGGWKRLTCSRTIAVNEARCNL